MVFSLLVIHLCSHRQGCKFQSFSQEVLEGLKQNYQTWLLWAIKASSWVLFQKVNFLRTGSPIETG